MPTDELTDEQFYERNPDFHEGSQLCLATINEDGTIANEVLINKPRGIIRDPNLSFDAKTLIFSMRDNFETDDNHLYKMSLPDRRVQQIMFSPTVAGKTLPCSDTEPCFAPNEEIIFQSTRCGQLDVCWPRPTANLYACDINGRYIRRLAIDQVRTLYPQVLEDGRIIYTRWEYNDRNQSFLQPLFVMNADGTAQTALYGNNSEYPTSLIHSRGIPGTSKVITVASGHHVMQKGKLAVIDRSKGSEGNSGIEYVAGASPDGKPGRQPSNTHLPFDRSPYDLFGQVGPQWQYPYAFDENHYFVAFNPEGYHFLKGPFGVPFGVYYMTAEGKRELLAFDWSNSCGQAIPLMPRQQPPVKPSQVDWNRNSGTFYVQNVYVGPGLEGVKKGTIKRLRVVALEYRAAGVSSNWNRGPGGGSPSQTPISIGNGCWDVKHVLGEVDVEEDGSAYFEVPARNSVYFQLLDEKGRCVQTMRSWTMVQPGERVGCVGCHENKLQTGLTTAKMPVAFNRPARKLQPRTGQPPHPLLVRLEKEGSLENVNNFLGVNKPCSLDPQSAVDGFSYVQMVQPVWDRHCITCHQGNVSEPDKKKRSALRLTGEVVKSPPPTSEPEWLQSTTTGGLRDFTQSYLTLTAQGQCTPLVNWVHPQSMSAMLPPYACGSTQSKLMNYLEPSHYDVQLTAAEKRIVACWIDLAVPFCGSYGQANTWNSRQKKLYEYFQMKTRAVRPRGNREHQSIDPRPQQMNAMKRGMLGLLMAGLVGGACSAAYLSPEYFAAAPDGKTLYVTAATSGKLFLFDIAGGKVAGEWSLPCNPSGVAVASDGSVFVSGGGVDGALYKFSPAGKVLAKVETGHTPMSPVVGKDGTTVYVLNRFNNSVAAVDTAEMKLKATIAVLREPHAAVLGTGGKLLFVANHLPACRATDKVVAAAVSVVDTATFKVVKHTMLPNGSTGVRGIGATPDGQVHLRHTHFRTVSVAHHTVGTRLDKHGRAEHLQRRDGRVRQHGLARRRGFGRGQPVGRDRFAGRQVSDCGVRRHARDQRDRPRGVSHVPRKGRQEREGHGFDQVGV